MRASENHPANPPTIEEWGAIFSLLDDETPEVARFVSERLRATDGDASEALASYGRALSAASKDRLAELLAPARRNRLEREWQVPTGGSEGLTDDWDAFEALTRAISDFQHDGVTLRQPMSDAMDLLAEEAAADGIDTARGLASWFFAGGRMVCVGGWDEMPGALDPAGVLDGERRAPVTACIVFCLVALRLDIEVHPALWGPSVLGRFYEDGGEWFIVFDEGGVIEAADSLFQAEDEFDPIPTDLTPGDLLVLYLKKLARNHAAEGCEDDLRLVRRLIRSLR